MWDKMEVTGDSHHVLYFWEPIFSTDLLSDGSCMKGSLSNTFSSFIEPSIPSSTNFKLLYFAFYFKDNKYICNLNFSKQNEKKEVLLVGSEIIIFKFLFIIAILSYD